MSGRAHTPQQPGLWRAVSIFCLLSLLAIVLSACAGTQQSERESATNLDHETLVSLILKLREEPEMHLPIAILCAAGLAEDQGEDFDYRSFFGALFEVSDAEAGLTFCRAFIEVAVAGDMTKTELVAIETPEKVQDYTVFGKLIRELLLAHERLTTQEAMRRPRS